MSDKVTTTRARAKNKPSVAYSDGLLASILDRVANGESLSSVCDADDMPSRKSFFQWVKDNPEIRAQYELAIQMRADKFAEDIIEIADEEVTMVKRSKHQPDHADENADVEVVFDPTAVARNRLRVDARKWLAGKMAPKKYGDKLDVEANLTGTVVIQASALDEKI